LKNKFIKNKFGNIQKIFLFIEIKISQIDFSPKKNSSPHFSREQIFSEKNYLYISKFHFNPFLPVSIQFNYFQPTSTILNPLQPTLQKSNQLQPI